MNTDLSLKVHYDFSPEIHLSGPVTLPQDAPFTNVKKEFFSVFAQTIKESSQDKKATVDLMIVRDIRDNIDITSDEVFKSRIEGGSKDFQISFAPSVSQVNLSSTATFAKEIPVVNMDDFYNVEKREEFLNTLHKAATTIGFFAVRNTGVDRSVVNQAYEEAKKFFKSDDDIKLSCFNKDVGGQRGFVPGESAKNSDKKDPKEFCHVGPDLSEEQCKERGIPVNIWPEQQPAFREAMVRMYTELNKYAKPLLQALTAVINLHSKTEKLADDYLENMVGDGVNTLLRALHYFASIIKCIWAGEHTDTCFATILPFATAKGLQVKIGDVWYDVVVPEDAFVVNIGDYLENLTNGLFKSAKHRVMSEEPGIERFSMVQFIHPSNDASLDPLQICIDQTGGVQKYAPAKRLNLLFERLLELGIAPDLLKPYAEMGHIETQMDYGRESVQVAKLLIENGLASQKVLEKYKHLVDEKVLGTVEIKV